MPNFISYVEINRDLGRVGESFYGNALDSPHSVKENHLN